MGRWSDIRTLCPWGDVAPSDTREAPPEIVADVRGQRLFGLMVHGEYVRRIGLAAIRCRLNGSLVIPIAMSIPDGIDLTAMERIEPAQGNPRRVSESWDADCV